MKGIAGEFKYSIIELKNDLVGDFRKYGWFVMTPIVILYLGILCFALTVMGLIVYELFVFFLIPHPVPAIITISVILFIVWMVWALLKINREID